MVETPSIDLPDGFRMIYRIAGPETDVPLLLLHGLGANHVQFEQDVAHFSQSRRVIQPDMRGHGDTGFPPDPKIEDFTCAKFAGDLAYLLDHLKIDKIDVVGNSLGGNIALELMTLRPGLVRSLMTFGTTYQLKVPRFLLVIRDIIYFFLGRKLARWAAEQTSKTPHGREVLTRTFEKMDRRVSKLVSPNICRFDYRAVAEQFSGPILLLQCEDDSAINRTLKSTLKTLSGLPNAQVMPFKTGGHCANVDDPERFHRIIDEFLCTVDSKDRPARFS
ncbi:MAG: alpha/beta hydrolase [Sphingomonadales bacterium]|nr:alpha/beta hydrolase [Sphingomonadales bacterium]